MKTKGETGWIRLHMGRRDRHDPATTEGPLRHGVQCYLESISIFACKVRKNTDKGRGGGGGEKERSN